MIEKQKLLSIKNGKRKIAAVAAICVKQYKIKSLKIKNIYINNTMT